MSRVFLSGGKFYGSDEFDPKFIITQIAVHQAGFYWMLATASIFIYTLAHLPKSPALLFNPAMLNVTDMSGRLMTIISVCTSIFLGLGVAHVVERSRKCLDYCSTVYILHLFICSLVHGLPSNLSWWVIEGFCCTIALLVSERRCRVQETAEIELQPTREVQSAVDRRSSVRGRTQARELEKLSAKGPGPTVVGLSPNFDIAMEALNIDISSALQRVPGNASTETPDSLVAPAMWSRPASTMGSSDADQLTSGTDGDMGVRQKAETRLTFSEGRATTAMMSSNRPNGGAGLVQARRGSLGGTAAQAIATGSLMVTDNNNNKLRKAGGAKADTTGRGSLPSSGGVLPDEIDPESLEKAV